MSQSVNKVFLMGNLGRKPELRRTNSGTSVTELSIALNKTYTDRNGEVREECVWVYVEVWEAQADACCKYLDRGSQVHVEGRLKMEEWEDKTTGEKRSRLKVTADRVTFVGGQPGGREGRGDRDDRGDYQDERRPRQGQPDRRGESSARPAPGRQGEAPRAQAQAAHSGGGGYQPDYEDDDIPF